MNLFNLMKIALRAIWSNKFRSFLSMLGIIIGVAAVIIMMSIYLFFKIEIILNKWFFIFNYSR